MNTYEAPFMELEEIEMNNVLMISGANLEVGGFESDAPTDGTPEP